MRCPRGHTHFDPAYGCRVCIEHAVASGTPPRTRAADACALALRWFGDPDDPTGTFEDIGDWYYRETGRLRPGKSEPLECGSTDPEERERHFRAWVDKKRREVRAALRAGAGL